VLPVAMNGPRMRRRVWTLPEVVEMEALRERIRAATPPRSMNHFNRSDFKIRRCRYSTCVIPHCVFWHSAREAEYFSACFHCRYAARCYKADCSYRHPSQASPVEDVERRHPGVRVAAHVERALSGASPPDPPERDVSWARGRSSSSRSPPQSAPRSPPRRERPVDGAAGESGREAWPRKRTWDDAGDEERVGSRAHPRLASAPSTGVCDAAAVREGDGETGRHAGGQVSRGGAAVVDGRPLAGADAPPSRPRPATVPGGDEHFLFIAEDGTPTTDARTRTAACQLCETKAMHLRQVAAHLGSKRHQSKKAERAERAERAAKLVCRAGGPADGAVSGETQATASAAATALVGRPVRSHSSRDAWLDEAMTDQDWLALERQALSRGGDEALAFKTMRDAYLSPLGVSADDLALQRDVHSAVPVRLVWSTSEWAVKPSDVAAAIGRAPARESDACARMEGAFRTAVNPFNATEEEAVVQAEASITKYHGRLHGHPAAICLSQDEHGMPRFDLAGHLSPQTAHPTSVCRDETFLGLIHPELKARIEEAVAVNSQYD
jgi:hypothetical protein